MNPDKDPAVDREEFEARLERMVNQFTGKDLVDCVKALINEDKATIDVIKRDMAAKQSKLDKYLADYDAAADEAARRVVVGSVKP